MLREYLSHPPGAPAASARPTGSYAGSPEEAWQAFIEALGLGAPAVGDHVVTDAGPFRLAGTVIQAGRAEQPAELLLRLTAPGAGVAILSAFRWNTTRVALSFYLYGDEAVERAKSMEAGWQTWLDERFPPLEDRR